MKPGMCSPTSYKAELQLEKSVATNLIQPRFTALSMTYNTQETRLELQGHLQKFRELFKQACKGCAGVQPSNEAQTEPDRSQNYNLEVDMLRMHFSRLLGGRTAPIEVARAVQPGASEVFQGAVTCVK